MLSERFRSLNIQFSVLMTAGVLAAAATTASVWWQVHVVPSGQQKSEVNAADLLTRSDASIAVLPFQYATGIDDGHYRGAGLAAEIISLLSRFSDLIVVSGESSFRYADTSLSAKDISRKLGVRYLLDGSIRRVGEHVRVDARLIDSRDTGRIWEFRFASETGSVLSARDDFARKIVSAMAIKIKPHDVNRPKTGGTEAPTAYDEFLQGRRYLKRGTAADTAHAVTHFKAAIALDPRFARAHAALALSYLIARRRLWHREMGLESKFEAEYKARQALREAMKSPTSLAHRVAAGLFMLEHRVEEALAETEFTIALDPNDPENYAFRAIALIWSGQPKEAVEAINKAIRLNPLYPAYYQVFLGIAKYAEGDFEAAREQLERARRRAPNHRSALVHLLAAEGQLGLSRESETTLSHINRLRRDMGLPPYSLWDAQDRIPYRRKQDMARLIEGLRKANVPDRITR